MNSFDNSESTITVSSFPPSISRTLPDGKIRFRAFGMTEADLDVDFSTKAPVVTTILLESCSLESKSGLPSGTFCDLPLGNRIQCLVALAAASDRPAFNFPLRCSGCGEEIELELTLEEISSKQRDSDPIEMIEVQIRGTSLAFRKPTGRDQEAWADKIFRDEEEATRAMIDTLKTSAADLQSLERADFERIDAAMDEADPLVNLICHVGCEECGEQNQVTVDLCEAALGVLRRLQKQLIVLIHKLASHYHWRESDIFAIPHWRRLEYLDLIDARR